MKGVSTLGLLHELSLGKQEYLMRLLEEHLLDEGQDVSAMSLNQRTTTKALAEAVDLHYDSDRQKLKQLNREYALVQLHDDLASKAFRRRICFALSFLGALPDRSYESIGSCRDDVAVESGDTEARVSSWRQRLLIGDRSIMVAPEDIEEGLQSLNLLLRPVVQVLSGRMSKVLALALALIAVLGSFIPDILVMAGVLDNVERFISGIGIVVPIVVGISVQIQNAQWSLANFKTSYTNACDKDVDLERHDRLQPRDVDGNETNRRSAILSEIAELEDRMWLVQGDSIDAVVRKRLESSGYENHLGVIHQAQQDLARLSRAFLSETKTSIFPRGKPRIVLVIDDLDRCPPEKVVETLEAAQLLVKTELFVVVMCLDARYVSLALEKKYEGILIPKSRPSGMDYLEKIIQLPYRLPPIDCEGTMELYLEHQMGEVEEEEEEEEEEVNGVQKSPRGGLKWPRPWSPSKTSSQPSMQPPVESPNPVSPNRSSNDPSNESEFLSIPHTVALKFNKTELGLLSKVCVAAGVSPRSGKRLVNVFKLLKLIWHRQDARTTEGEKQVARKACLLLLAMCASSDKDLHFAMGRVFANVERRKRMHGSKNLRDLVVEAAADDGAIEPCRHLVDEWLVDVSWSNEEEWAEIRQYLRLVRSFSFVDPLSGKGCVM